VTTATVLIRGMNSAASVMRVQSALSVIRGVYDVRLWPEQGRAVVSFNRGKVHPQQLRTAVGVTGCEVEALRIATTEAGASWA